LKSVVTHWMVFSTSAFLNRSWFISFQWPINVVPPPNLLTLALSLQRKTFHLIPTFLIFEIIWNINLSGLTTYISADNRFRTSFKSPSSFLFFQYHPQYVLSQTFTSSGKFGLFQTKWIMLLRFIQLTPI
jgi:hypothetical protein